MFDLNKSPSLEGDLFQGFGAEANQFQSSGMSSSFRPWQYSFGPSDLASLFNMVQELPNYYPGAASRMISGHSWASSWLPPHTTFSGAPVMNTTSMWRRSPFRSYLSAVAAPARSTTVPASVTASPFFKHRRVVEVRSRPPAGPHFSVNPIQSMCQTTTDMDSHAVSDGESDCNMPKNHRADHSKGLSGVRLLELETRANDCKKLPVAKGKKSPAKGKKSPANLGKEAPSQDDGDSDQEPRFSTCMWLPEKLDEDDAVVEERKKRELAFNAAFKFPTRRCIPTAPCKTCLDFCKSPLPLHCAEHAGPLGALYNDDEDLPPVLKNMSEAEAKKKGRRKRHGPRSKSSKYRGVTFYKRTGRWEAHIWYQAAQVYLGASATKEEAARAYDKAGLMLFAPGVDINFKPESYQQEMAYLYKLSKEQLVIYLRRDSRGYGAQATYPGVKRGKNHYTAKYGDDDLGTFATEDEAARAVYKEAVRDCFGELASFIIDTYHVRNMPSYGAQRFAALYPETVEFMMQLRAQSKASPPPKNISVSKRQSSTSSPEKEMPGTRTATKPNHSSCTPAANATANSPYPGEPEHQLPRILQINEAGGSPGARIPHILRSHLSQRKVRQHLDCILKTQAPTSAASLPNKAKPHDLQSEVNGTRAPQHTWPKNLYPISAWLNPVPPAIATTVYSAWSTCQAASVPTTFSRTGPPATSRARPEFLPSGSVESSHSKKRPTADPGSIKFKLFNVEISVPEPGDGANGESGGLGSHRVIDKQAQLPPRKRCRMTEEAEAAFVPYSGFLRFP